MRGILESGAFWVTDIFSLNDPSELKHGIKLAEKALSTAATEQTALKAFFENEMRVMFDHDLADMASFFVCCFSRNGNELGQWRAYADNGRGYALGFDRRKLEQAFVAQTAEAAPGTVGAGPMTFPVTYDDNLLQDLQQRVIAKFVPLILAPKDRDLQKDLLQNYRGMLATNLTIVVVWASMFFKHPAYKSEDEYRFLMVREAGTRSHVKYRHRPHSLVRYEEFDWRTGAAGPLKEIIIGPAADPLLSHRFANDCLNTFHYPRHPGDIFSD